MSFTAHPAIRRSGVDFTVDCMTQSKEPEAENMIDEFRNIVRELEEEVIEALITQKSRSLKRSKL